MQKKLKKLSKNTNSCLYLHAVVVGIIDLSQYLLLLI